MQPRTAIRAARAFGRYQLGAVHNVLAASLMVTRRCTLRCGYCSRHTPINPELGTTQWLRLIDELAAHGCAQLSLTGGEPLLRDDLGALMRRARARHIKVKLNTNGMLVPRKLDVVAMADGVTLSIDGPRDVHDASRGRGSYDHVLKAADAVQRLGIPLRFYTVLSRDNLPRLGELVDLAASYDGTVFFQPGTATILGADDQPNPMAPDVDAYRQTIDRLIEWRGQGRPVGNSRSALRYLRQWPDLAPPSCSWRAFVRVEEDGQLRTCGRDTQHERINVAELGLARALSQRPAPTCTSCWTAARVELHLIASGDLAALADLVS